MCTEYLVARPAPPRIGANGDVGRGTKTNWQEFIVRLSAVQCNVDRACGLQQEDESMHDYYASLCPRPAIYSHCYDRSGARLAAAGGPIAASLVGNYAAIWQ